MANNGRQCAGRCRQSHAVSFTSRCGSAGRAADDRPLGGRKPVALREIEVLPLESSRDANTFAREVARRAPRGHYPRATVGEGTFWTVVGVPLDDHEALVSEDGAVEVDKRGFSIEPFLWVNGELHTWADAMITQLLAEDCAPVPTVLREYDGLSLEVTAFADGAPGRTDALVAPHRDQHVGRTYPRFTFLGPPPFSSKSAISMAQHRGRRGEGRTH